MNLEDFKIQDSSKVFWTSDTHFYHERILTLGKGRPYKSIDEMHESMINNWNSVVKHDDLVIHQGDLSWHGVRHLIDIVKQLNGNIILLKGNHDKFQNGQVKNLFVAIAHYLELSVKDPEAENGWQPVVSMHYPILSFNGMYKGKTIHTYGHEHHNMIHPDPRAIDVGVDGWNYTPVSYEQIKQAVKEKTLGKSGQKL